jgi:exodeoxyribonuclease VII large subunit
MLGLPVVETTAGGPTARAWSVAALLLAVSDALATRFAAVVVEGELSGFSRAASGHCYFTLKDRDGAAASLRCAMFRRAATLVDFAPRDGMAVELRGRIALYEPRGEMQFVVESMRTLGAGSLYEQFLRSKAKLEAEGLFDAARKRELPTVAQSVGVVTSASGAAVHDIVTTLARRAPHVRVVIYPSVVQGAEAPAALLRALAQAARRREVDVLIVARGGGSIEDLWAFNDEGVVRAVAAMPMPTLAGVGHETDVTLVDFAADRRAATPTAAAELAAPNRDDLLALLAQIALQMRRRVRQRLDQQAQRLDQRALQLARPAAWWQREARRLEALAVRLRQAAAASLRGAGERPRRLDDRLRHAVALLGLRQRAALESLGVRHAALDPQAVIGRGYALVRTTDGAVLREPGALHAGLDLDLTLSGGSAQVTLAAVRDLGPR